MNRLHSVKIYISHSKKILYGRNKIKRPMLHSGLVVVIGFNPPRASEACCRAEYERSGVILTEEERIF